MRRALELAARGDGLVSPNPLVGCVLVRDGTVIGEGWHQGPGTPHAEIAALANANCAQGATAYVTLEPCNHMGRTGPCAEALITAGITRVVYAISDPNVIAAGGDATLKAAGVETDVGIHADDARNLNKFWLHSLSADRPYVIAKMAMSLDGQIATASGNSKWITGPDARRRAHALRRSVDTIIAGAQTIIADDPSLTARNHQDLPLDDAYQPQRIILDSTGRTSPGAKAFERSGKSPILATLATLPASKRQAFCNVGVECLSLDRDQHDHPDVEHLLKTLAGRNVQSVLIEGGGQTTTSFLKSGLVDELWAFVAVNKIIGGDGRSAVGSLGLENISDTLNLKNITTEFFGADLLIHGLINKPGAK